jgi:hypothetical protein
MANDTWRQRAIASTAASLSDKRGSGFAQAIILVVVLALGGMAGFKSLSGGISDKSACTGEAIMSLAPGAARCAGAAVVDPPVALPDAPSEEFPAAPILEGAGPIIALPFPGSVAVTCTAFRDQQRRCKGQPGVRVQATGEVSVDRGKTRLDDKGCPKQDLSVSAKLQVELSGQARGKDVGGTLAVFTGTSSKFKVTVSPDAADAIARGDRPPPNPVDPTTLLPGESLELSEEFYAGVNLTATYRALQVQMGFEEGRKLSSGVKRIDADTVRIFVGDSEFVRQALSLGLGVGGVGVSIGNKDELSSGELRAVDIDISTPEGFAAYQEFLSTGRLPAAGAPGTSDPTTAETLDITDTTRVEGKLGPVKLGGVLGSSEAHLTETRHADGTVESVLTGRFNSVGLAVRTTTSPDGTTDTSFSLLIEGASRSSIENFEEFSGQSLAASEDGNVRFDFTESDLRTIREQALDQLAFEAEQNGLDLSRDEIERLLREDPRQLENAGLNGPDHAFEIASAQSPEEILLQLYKIGGAFGDPSATMEGLLEFIIDTADARHGLRSVPADHPDSLLPGTRVAPACS